MTQSPRSYLGVVRAGLGTSLEGAAGCRSLGGLFRAFRLRYLWRGPWFFVHRFRGVHFTRLMCGDGRTGAGVHFAECACWPGLAAVKCSATHLPIWAILDVQDIVRKN